MAPLLFNHLTPEPPWHGSPDLELPDTTLFVTVFFLQNFLASISALWEYIKNLQASISVLQEFVTVGETGFSALRGESVKASTAMCRLIWSGFVLASLYHLLMSPSEI